MKRQTAGNETQNLCARVAVSRCICSPIKYQIYSDMIKAKRPQANDSNKREIRLGQCSVLYLRAMRVLRVGHGARVRQILFSLLARLLLSRAVDALLMRELQRGQLLLEPLALGGLCAPGKQAGECVCV